MTGRGTTEATPEPSFPNICTSLKQELSIDYSLGHVNEDELQLRPCMQEHDMLQVCTCIIKFLMLLWKMVSV